ncbi:MAG: JAB domain-containing protein [Candidatus Anammoxibacter sp.]
MYVKELTVSYRKKRVPKTAHKCIGKKITCPGEIYSLFKCLWKESVEKFYVLHLDTKNVIQSMQLISIGSLTRAIVHPIEVFKGALIANSVSIVFVHNHPAGDPFPSNEDIKITRQLKNAGKIIGINVLDHIVVGDNRYFSLKDKKLL